MPIDRPIFFYTLKGIGRVLGYPLKIFSFFFDYGIDLGSPEPYTGGVGRVLSFCKPLET